MTCNVVAKMQKKKNECTIFFLNGVGTIAKEQGSRLVLKKKWAIWSMIYIQFI